MAGIGFELRKIYGKKTLASKIYGTLYASMSTLGPTLVFVVFLMLISFVMERLGMPEIDKLFFTTALIQLFLSAVLISSVHNTVVSRYVSDKVFENNEPELSKALYGCIITGTVCASIVMLLLCANIYRNGMTDPVFLVSYYLLGIFAADAYNLLTFISALKEYRKITVSYFVGLFFSAPVFILLHHFTRLSLIQSGLVSICLAFFLIDVFLVYCCIRAFDAPADHRELFTFLAYYKKYPALALSGLTYIAGFYATNVIYWNFSESYTTVVYGIKSMPAYDYAIFLAFMVNLSSMVIFVVKTETVFYDSYISYLSMLTKGSYARLEKARLSLQRTLQTQLFYVYDIQLIITILAICTIVIFSTSFALSEIMTGLFVVLALGVYCVFCMYFTIIMLYYFQDYKGAAVASSVFLAVEVAACFICMPHGIFFYSIPTLAGGAAGWIISFVRLRMLLRDLNSYMLCRQE